jgi:tetratricopeptide (TPR) repeat protein
MIRIFLLISLLVKATVLLACPTDLGMNGFHRPLDYNDPDDQYQIKINVERNHFTPNVEALIKGQTGDLGADLALTLRAVPNHYRALYAMSRWQLENGFPANDERIWPVDCYFTRALLFKPEDPTIYMLYGIYLHKAGKLHKSLEEYKNAEKYAPDLTELHYNMGLLYFDLKDYDMALIHAQKAYKQGYPLPGLRDKLIHIGKWHTPPPS